MKDWSLLIPFGALFIIGGGIIHGIYSAYKRSKQGNSGTSHQ